MAEEKAEAVENVGVKQEPYTPSNDTKLAVGKALGITDLGKIDDNQHQIERLIEWANARGAKDDADVVWSVRQLANRVGAPGIGNNWAQHLSTYAYLEMEKLKIDKQLKEIENGNRK